FFEFALPWRKVPAPGRPAAQDLSPGGRYGRAEGVGPYGPAKQDALDQVVAGGPPRCTSAIPGYWLRWPSSNRRAVVGPRASCVGLEGVGSGTLLLAIEAAVSASQLSKAHQRLEGTAQSPGGSAFAGDPLSLACECRRCNLCCPQFETVFARAGSGRRIALQGHRSIRRVPQDLSRNLPASISGHSTSRSWTSPRSLQLSLQCGPVSTPYSEARSPSPTGELPT